MNEDTLINSGFASVENAVSRMIVAINDDRFNDWIKKVTDKGPGQKIVCCIGVNLQSYTDYVMIVTTDDEEDQYQQIVYREEVERSSDYANEFITKTEEQIIPEFEDRLKEVGVKYRAPNPDQCQHMSNVHWGEIIWVKYVYTLLFDD